MVLEHRGFPMASPQNPPHDESPILPAVDGAAQDPERVGLLGYTRMLDRRPSSTELRLGIVAFWFLCLASIGFGLFAGERTKFLESEPIHDRPIQIITSTVFLSPTNTPSPPGRSSNVCSSGPCVDVAGDLRRTIQWSGNPCEDFAKFSTAQTREPASDVISSEIDQIITKTLSFNSINPTTRKLQAFKSLCSNKTRNISYFEFSPILRQVSTLFSTNNGYSKADRFGAVLAYLHSASIPAFFKITATNYQFKLQPQKVSVEGIEDAFASLYPANEVSKRIAGVKTLVSTLSPLVDSSQETKSITIDDLQDWTCAQSWIPCWIHWKDFYSALGPGRVVRMMEVQGIDYFRQLGRVFLEQPDIFLESYFHWLTIATISKKNCQEELKLHFGPNLLKNLFLNSQEQLRDWRNRTRAAEFFLQSLRDLSPNSGLPQAIETPSTEDDREEELSSIRSDNWVDTAFTLARIKTRKEFSGGQPYWSMMGTELKIVGDKLYFPMGALQSPLLYWSLSDLPKSLLFGSVGFNMFAELEKLRNHSSNFENTCQLSLTKAFEIWKKYKDKNPNEMKIKLVGLINEIQNSDQLFYLAFGRLGIICPDIENDEDFIQTFHCSSSKYNSK